ncbi:lysylphosphatidylglycerol synthase transmembrane domain-containing protein [Thermovibrio sp.]
MKRKSSFIISALIILLFAYFLYEYKAFKGLKEIASSLHPLYLLFSLITYLATYFFRAKRFKVMFPQIKTAELVAVMTVHTFFNNALPFRSGEASFPIILKKLFKVDATISSGALAFARILDLLSLSLLFLISAAAVATNRKELFIIPLLAFLILSAFAFLALKLLGKIKNKFLFAQALFLFFNSFISFKKLFLIGAYSLLTWLFKFISFYFILKGGSIKINFFQTVFVSTFGELTTVLPIHSIGGFGTYEAGLVGGFKLLGIKTGYALTVAFYFHLVLFTMSALLALFGWSYLLIKVKKA